MEKVLLSSRKCSPCEGFETPLAKAQAQPLLHELDYGWELIEDAARLRKDFVFRTFRDAINFVNNIADLAEAEGHHPNITILYNKVRITCTTHVIKGLSENDFILASKIDQLASRLKP